MGDGYTRQSAADIVTGNVVEAGPLNAEFNQLRDAFHETSGHSHDGTTGEGPKIALTTSISGILPVANGGFAGIHNLSAVLAPTVNDDSADGYVVGSHWINVSADTVYICADNTLGAAVWKRMQEYDAELAALAGLTSAADKLPYFTGSGTAALADLSSFARTIIDDANAGAVLTTLGVSAYAQTILDDANAATARGTLGLVIGTDVQAYSASITNLASAGTTNKLYYLSATNTWTAVTIGSGLSFTGGTLDSVAPATDATITSIAALTPTTDQFIYFTATDTAATGTVTSFARSLLDDTTASAARTTLGLVIGTDVQAYDADLATIAGLTATTDNFIVSVASAWASRTPAQVKTTLSLDQVSNTSDATKNSATATLTNKRITKRVDTQTSSATPTPDSDNYDMYLLTALAVGAVFAAPTGTPTQGQQLIVRIKDNGTARALSWNSIYRAMGTALPTTTILGKTLYLGFIYNSTDTKWDLVASAQEA